MGAQNPASVHVQRRNHVKARRNQCRRGGKSGKHPLIIQPWNVEGQESASADQVAMTPAVKMEVALKMFPAVWVVENFANFIARSASSSSSSSSLFRLRLLRWLVHA